MHVLFVDDNPLMQQVISRFLVSQGYSVAIADSAEQALHLTRQERYHLVVIDMRLPDRDGLICCRPCARNPGWRTVRRLP